MIPNTRKEEVVDKLIATKQKADRLYLNLRLLREEEEAKKARTKGKKLGRQIEVLLGKMMEQWGGNADKMIGELAEKNLKIQKSIAGIKKGVNRIAQTAKALSLIDDVIKLAGGLIL